MESVAGIFPSAAAYPGLKTLQLQMLNAAVDLQDRLEVAPITGPTILPPSTEDRPRNELKRPSCW